MNKLIETCAKVGEPNEGAARQTQALLDAKTKPRGSLGRLERLACQIAAASHSVPLDPRRKAMVVMAADHGVAEEGISAYPPEVTAQMLANFARGGAAINVLARHVAARLVVIDMGVKAPPPDLPDIRCCRIGPGTGNFAKGPAMTREDGIRAVEAGIEVALDLVQGGANLLGIGDMGIGNTTSASAISAALVGVPADKVVGRGTGIDDRTLQRKIDIVHRALQVHRPDPRDPLDVLSKVGGFEIAALAGVVLASAASRVPVIVDGFPCGAAALVAARLAPRATGYMIFAHRSVEPGHRLVLDALDAMPLLDLNLRLGEGTGAALAMTMVDASLSILREMASFASSGVADTGA